MKTFNFYGKTYGFREKRLEKEDALAYQDVMMPPADGLDPTYAQIADVSFSNIVGGELTSFYPNVLSYPQPEASGFLTPTGSFAPSQVGAPFQNVAPDQNRSFFSKTPRTGARTVRVRFAKSMKLLLILCFYQMQGWLEATSSPDTKIFHGPCQNM